MLHDRKEQEIAFHITMPSPCGYLPGHRAVTVFADPLAGMSPDLYSTLVEHGFRRSGDHVYIPYCPNCDSCIPARVAVDRFQMTRGQRRVWKRNADLTAMRVGVEFSEEHFALYQTYVSHRHAGGGMEDYSASQYMSFLDCSWGDTFLVEFRLAAQLVAVASIDQLADGLSAVYTFFDPALSFRSLGTYAVMWQIHEAARRNLSYVYLGYLIPSCDKMKYKSNFHPLEIHRNGIWTVYRPA